MIAARQADFGKPEWMLVNLIPFNLLNLRARNIARRDADDQLVSRNSPIGRNAALKAARPATLSP